jgi:cytochrome o ubiquinol oxidase subunit 2
VSVVHFRDYIDILFPTGIVAAKELNLLLIIQGLMLLVIIPVYILTFAFSWRYRAGNKDATYDPDLIDNRFAEYVWWGLPLVMTAIIAILTWIKTHELDPFKPLDANKKAMKIQAVALQWKWLFIYPEEKIAVVNFLQIPKDVPVHFEITADAPMNSLWIPDLGGQIYAMPKMRTELNLIANKIGDSRGSSANISGEGFAGMNFITRASTEEDYRKWVETAQKAQKGLDWKEYVQLAAPSQYVPVEYFRLDDASLFDQIIAQYMHPQNTRE